MYKYHSDIPREYRTVILAETGQTRVTNVSIAECNEIIEEILRYEAVNAELLNFKLLVEINGKNTVYELDSMKSSLAKLDEITDYGLNKIGVTAVLFQADKPFRAWTDGVEINLPKKHNDVAYH